MLFKGSDGKKSVIEVYSKFDLEYSASSTLANEVRINTDVDLGRNLTRRWFDNSCTGVVEAWWIFMILFFWVRYSVYPASGCASPATSSLKLPQCSLSHALDWRSTASSVSGHGIQLIMWQIPMLTFSVFRFCGTIVAFERCKCTEDGRWSTREYIFMAINMPKFIMQRLDQPLTEQLYPYQEMQYRWITLSTPVVTWQLTHM